MSKRALDVGTMVRLPQLAAGTITEADESHIEYRIEQLVRLKTGATLYKVKCETEPFDRIVCENDVALQP